MAILPQIPGLCVSIRVADEPAEEYHPPHITPIRDPEIGDVVPTTHCFIESQTGKNFCIRYRFCPLFTFPDGSDAIMLTFFIDGIVCQHLVLIQEDLDRAQDYIQDMWFRSVEKGNGRSENYSLMFQEIAPVEEAKRATVVSDLKRVKDLGTIKVMISFGKTSEGPGRYDLSDERNNESLHVAQKALVLEGQEKTHGTSYHRIHVDEAAGFEYVTFDHSSEHTIGCFYFSYMSRALLLSNNILNPAFVNHDAHFVQHTRKGYPMRANADGKIEIDLTGEE